MKVDILINDISGLSTRTKLVEGNLVTTIQFDAKVPVQSLARILNLQRQGAPILVTIGSPQAVMDLAIHEDRGEQGAQDSSVERKEGSQ